MKNKKLIIQNLLAYDLDFQVKCLELLYQRQTLDERQAEKTQHDNQQGFTTGDAPVLTLIAEAGRAKQRLTAMDKHNLQIRMPKYATQLLPLVSDKEIL